MQLLMLGVTIQDGTDRLEDAAMLRLTRSRSSNQALVPMKEFAFSFQQMYQTISITKHGRLHKKNRGPVA